jgi:hypothetical protein
MTAHVTMDIATEERCFLCDPYLDIISRPISGASAVQGSEEFVGELVREMQFSHFEPMLLECVS